VSRCRSCRSKRSNSSPSPTVPPYGRGEATLVDTDVRRTWQIDADRVHIAGRHWEQTLEAIVAGAAQGLGVPAPVAAKLYKLLV
jgi:hypothetical protein